MSLFSRFRKRPRPSSSSDEVCTSWFSTDPKDLPQGFTVGSMSCPYPPPHYKQQSTEKRKKKREKKSNKSRKPRLAVQRKVVHDFRPFPKSRDFDGEIKQEKEEGDGVELRVTADLEAAAAGAVCTPPLTTGTHDSIVPHTHADSATASTEKRVTDQPQCDGPAAAKPQQVDPERQPEGGVNQNNNHEEAEKPQVVKVRLNDSPKEKRLSNRSTLLRSCSADNIDRLCRGQETPPPPQKSSKEVEEIRKPMGISIDEDQKANQSGSVRPFLTHHPRSHQIRHRRIVSEVYNMGAVGSSPDLLKKQSSYQTLSKKTLYKPKNAEVLIETIRMGVDVNTLDEVTGNASIHAIVSLKKRRDKVELLLALLIYSKVDINLPNRRQMTALHLAIEEGDELCIRALLAFGANINAEGRNQFTPLDLATNKDTIRDIETTLTRMGAKTSSRLIREASPIHDSVPRLYSFAENMKPPPINELSSRLMTDIQSELANQQAVMEMYRDLEVKINQKLSLSASYSETDESPEEAYALLVQQRELNRFNKTLQKSGIGVFSGVEGGSRILFLDGGGIKGLVQLEVLMQLEEKTGRKITELFDWIVGTSTGGVIALTLVYGKKSLREIFQLYFMMKDRIFSKSRIGFGFNTEALEEILQEYLDPDIKMTDVTHPKVLISAVNKATTNLELHFFNNCFGDDYMDYPVWKVARYTSATPMFFSECDNYIDGGVICNNPTEYGLTAIQNFFRQQGKRLPIALVVSIGTGVYPAEELGSIDLFLGIGTLTRIKQRTQNLISLLGNALVESEMVANNSQSRCREQGIPFYRFSPKLRDVIAGSETDNEKLFNMVIQTRIDTREQGMEEVVRLFHTIAGASHHLAPRIEVEVSAIERENHRENEQCPQELVQKEKLERNGNLNDQPTAGLLKTAPPSGSSQPVLSDIEESVEVGSKKSLSSVPQHPSQLATFVVGEEAQDMGGVSDRAAEATVGRESEIDGPSEQDVRRSGSAKNGSALGGGGEMGEQKIDVVLERESQTHEESPPSEADVIRSQDSSELASPNQPEVSSPHDQGNSDDDDDKGLNAQSQEFPGSQSSRQVNTVGDVAVIEVITSLLEPAVASSTDHGLPSSVKLENEEIDNRIKPQTVLNEPLKELTAHPVEIIEDQTTSPEASQQSEDDQRMPPSPVDDHASTDQPSSNSIQQDLELPSQQTLEENDARSIAVTACKPLSFSSQQEGSLKSHELVITSEKFAEEEEEVWSHQMKQEGLNVPKEESPGSAVNGGSIIGAIIPMGSSHSSFISLESSQLSGPPKRKVPRTASDERGIPSGDVHFAPLTVPSTPAAEQHSVESQSNIGVVNGYKSHTQVPKLESSTNVRGEAPINHYKLDTQLTPETQQDAQSKFPYRFETEI